MAPSDKDSARPPAAEREAKLAQALRANLRRRKAGDAKRRRRADGEKRGRGLSGPLRGARAAR